MMCEEHVRAPLLVCKKMLRRKLILLIHWDQAGEMHLALGGIIEDIRDQSLSTGIVPECIVCTPADRISSAVCCCHLQRPSTCEGGLNFSKCFCTGRVMTVFTPLMCDFCFSDRTIPVKRFCFFRPGLYHLAMLHTTGN